MIELLLYIMFFLFIILFYNVFVFCKNNCCRERKVKSVNGFNLDLMNELVNSYEMVEEENIICPITQENILIGDNIEELPCGHKFSDSIYKWIQIKNECPVCRENILENIV